MVKKITKKRADITKVSVAKKAKVIIVKNADGDPDTTADVLVQNSVKYTPKVSVIIPVYNVEKYLRECLDSVCAQTLKEIEIICVDDGSTDSSLEILKEYAKKDNRITVLAQRNLHAGVARNAGLAVATGDYLSFLDSDDFFELNMLEEMYNKAKADKADIVVCNWDVKDEINNVIKKSIGAVPCWVRDILNKNECFNFAEKTSEFLMGITNPAPWNKLYNASFIKNTNIRFQNLTCCNDIGFSVSVMALASKIYVIDKVLAHYRKYSTNTSHSKHSSDNIIKAATYIQSNLLSCNLMDKFKDAFYRGISNHFYYEYCRTSDLESQKKLYAEFLPSDYFEEFVAKYDLNRKRKICLVGTNNVCVTVGGAITVFWERAEYFAQQGFDVVCAYENADNDKKLDNGIKQVNLWNYKNSSLPANERFKMFLETEKPDVLIFLMPSTVLKYTDNVDISKYKSILMVHSRPDIYFEGHLNKEDLLKACSKMDYMQVLMPSFMTKIKSYFPKHKTCVIPNYVLAVDNKKSNDTEYKKLIFFSRCDIGKNIPLLLNAFKIVHDKHPGWSLEIYGDSEPESYNEKCKRLSNLLGLTDSVKFGGRSPNGKEVLSTADIFVFPSYFEGQSLGVCEALSAGLPCVGLKGCSGTNEIVKDGFNGLLADDTPCDFADKILQLIENRKLRKEMSKNAIESMKPYTKKNIEEAWLKLVVSVINDKFVQQEFPDLCVKNYDISYIHSVWGDFNPQHDKPLVSVIMGVYNVNDYIDEAIQSLQKQTFSNIEIICVDDCSTDGSYQKLLKYQEQDNRIKVYRNQTNSKPGFSRNFGVQKSRGEYVFFCDGDDFIKPETIENLYNKIKKYDAEICQYSLCVYDNNKKEVVYLPNQNFEHLKHLNSEVYNYKDYPKVVFEHVEPVLKLYKKKFLIDNNIKFFEGCYFEDTIVHIMCTALAKRICYDDNIYYFYRKNREGQITGSAQNTDKFLDIFNYINKAEEFLKRNKLWKDLEHDYYVFCIERFCAYYNRCNESTKEKFADKIRSWFKNKKTKRVFLKCSVYKNNIQQMLKSEKISYKKFLLFPYYLCANWYMKHLKMPWLKCVKKIKAFVYLRSYRGKMDVLNAKFADVLRSVQSVKNDMTQQIVQIKNQQNELVKQISDVDVKQRKLVNDNYLVLSKQISELATYVQNRSNSVDKQISDLATYVQNRSDGVDKQISDLATYVQDRSDVVDKQISDLATYVQDRSDGVDKCFSKMEENIGLKSEALFSQVADLKTIIKSETDKLFEQVQDVNNKHQIEILSDKLDVAQAEIVDKTKSVIEHLAGAKSELVNEIDTLHKSGQDANNNIVNEIGMVKSFADKLAKQYSEPYWANVYHDTINNTNWLNNKSVSPGRWAVSYIVLYVLYRILDEIKPQSILECGLGQSSKLTIQYADAHNADLTICENNPDWLAFFQRQFPTAGMYTKILDTEMINVVPEYESRTYVGFKSLIGDKKFNLILIDGPLGSAHFSRPQILDVVDNLDKSFVILLDDMNRIGEQEIFNLLKKKLHEKHIEFKEGSYESDKRLGLICSPDLGWLTTL